MSRFSLDEMSPGLSCLLRVVFMVLATAAFLAIEILIIYLWWTNYHLSVLWLVLMVAAAVLYAALLMALADADRIAF